MTQRLGADMIYAVQNGDTPFSLCGDLQIFDFDAFWDHPENASAKEYYDEHGELPPGRQLLVPSASRNPLLPPGKHKLVVRRPRAELALVVESPGGMLLADCEYSLSYAGQTKSGKTDSSGTLRVALPLNVLSVHLRVTPSSKIREDALHMCHANDAPDCTAEAYEFDLSLA